MTHFFHPIWTQMAFLWENTNDISDHFTINTCIFFIFQLYQTKVEEELVNLKTYESSLTSQIDGLKMVSTLFGVINFQVWQKFSANIILIVIYTKEQTKLTCLLDLSFEIQSHLSIKVNYGINECRIYGSMPFTYK